MSVIRVAIISHEWYKDYPYLQEQLNRLASIYHEVVIIHGGEPVRYGMFLTDWCVKHDNFTEIIEAKSARLYGAGSAGTEQAERMLDWEPDEVWKFETSPGSKRRPDHPIFPELWYMAAHRKIPCRRFAYPYKGRRPTETDVNGFPKPIRVREWDGERWGVSGRSKGIQRYSNTPRGKQQRRARRDGRRL
jgi:hypothetical protein